MKLTSVTYQLEDEIGVTISPIEISETLSGIISEFALEVPHQAREFIESLLIEAARTRLDELAYGSDTFKVMSIFEESTRIVLHEASILTQKKNENGQPIISIISLLQSIHKNFCNIWPFCPTEPPKKPGK